MTKTKPPSPEQQATRPGRGGNVPPAHSRFKKGQSGNPRGRRSGTQTLLDYLSQFGDKQNLTDAYLRRIVLNEKAHPFKKMTAEQVLHGRMARMSDYEKLANGQASPSDLEKAGIDTTLVKKLKERQEFDKDGQVTGVTRELELHNLAGEVFDRIADRTEGKPHQSIGMDAAVHMTVEPVVIERPVGPPKKTQ